MLSENIKAIRESKGLSQDELAAKLNVVRQTVSKWERGLSVPDADALVSLSEALGTSVSVLLGETVSEPKADDLRSIAEKLEVINLQLARRRMTRRKVLLGLFAAIFVVTLLTLACLLAMGSPYQTWDYGDPETAVVGTMLHAFEWVFGRAWPFLLVGSAAGFCLVLRRGGAA